MGAFHGFYVTWCKDGDLWGLVDDYVDLKEPNLEVICSETKTRKDDSLRK